MKKGLLLFKMLSDETRLNIVEFLLDGEKCVCEIFPKVKRTQSTVSIHLAILERAGIVCSRREGKQIKYRIKDERVCSILRVAGNKKAISMEMGSCRKKSLNLEKVI